MKNKLELSIDKSGQTVSLSMVDEQGNGKIIFHEVRLNGGSFCNPEYFDKMTELLTEMVAGTNAYREANGYDTLPLDARWVGEPMDKDKPVKVEKEKPMNVQTYKRLVMKRTPGGHWDNGLYMESDETVSIPTDLLKTAVIVDKPSGVEGVNQHCSRITIGKESFLVLGKVKV